MEATVKTAAQSFAPDESNPAVNSILGANPFVDLGAKQALETVGRLARHVAGRPRAVVSSLSRLGSSLAEIAAGMSEIEPEPGDRRFTDPAFAQHPVYRRMMQTYLAWRRAMREMVGAEADGDWKEDAQLRFAMALITETLAPTNALLGNPAALKRAFDTAGMSLVRGLRNWADDLVRNGGMPSQVDKRPFQVGKNIAASPGTVVHRGPLCELIQYRPKTDKVFRRPLVLVPPQINKFYVMDLAPGRSFTEYALRAGVQFFSISWRNPTRALSQLGLDDYVAACREALKVACEITESPDCNLAAVCAGGITAALLLGYLAARGEQMVNGATLMVTMLDTSMPSMSGMFATSEGVAAALARSRQKGVLVAVYLQKIFAWLRPNDLVWNYWVNNYLMGDAPPAYDILFWNNDSTNLPARLHQDFLDLFLRNPLATPNAVKILGTPVNLGEVKNDLYVLAGQTDHIASWRACYKAARMFGSRIEFVLNSSGHVQSLVCPPGNFKAHYFTNSELADSPDGWLEHARENHGTWWDHWLKWISARSGEERAAPAELGSLHFGPLDPAPGLYVLERH